MLYLRTEGTRLSAYLGNGPLWGSSVSPLAFLPRDSATETAVWNVTDSVFSFWWCWKIYNNVLKIKVSNCEMKGGTKIVLASSCIFRKIYLKYHWEQCLLFRTVGSLCFLNFGTWRWIRIKKKKKPSACFINIRWFQLLQSLLYISNPESYVVLYASVFPNV